MSSFWRSTLKPFIPAPVVRMLRRLAWRPEISAGSTPVALEPHMSAAETELFKKYLGVTKKYVEFGAGGSLCLAVGIESINTLYGVEGDKRWLNHMMLDARILENVTRGRLHLFHADIGPTGDWSVPLNAKHVSRWPFYSLGIWRHLPKDFDFILIDGRFRVACALVALLMMEGHPVYVGLHDYPQRPEYHLIEKYMDLADSADTLFVFRPRGDYNRAELLLDIYDHLLLPTDAPNDPLVDNLELRKNEDAFESLLSGRPVRNYP